MTSVRYFVHDVDEAVRFYSNGLGFTVRELHSPAIAILARGDLTLWLAGPTSSGARPMPDGRRPEPGGWNRFVLQVEDLPALVDALRDNGIPFRNEIVTGPGGRQILVEDPSGNVIELFEPSAP